MSAAAGLAAAALVVAASEGASRGPEVERAMAAGIQNYKAQKYIEAIALFEAALEKAKHPPARREIKVYLSRSKSALGVKLFNAGESRQAEQAFREALGYHEDSYAHFGLGFVYFQARRSRAARRHLMRALAMDDRHGRTFKLLALLDYRAGESARALSRMRRAVALDSKDKEAAALLARWRRETAITKRFASRETDAFRLRSDPALDSKAVDRAVRILTGARRKLAERLGFSGAGKVVVVLFSNESFHKATGSHHWVGGMFDGQLKVPVPDPRSGASMSEGDLAELVETLQHEWAHVLVAQLSPGCPVWLNEGIAQHFDGTGDWKEARRRLRKAGELLSFASIPSRLWEVEDEALARKSYLQGWGFVEFLVHRYSEFRLRLLLDTLRDRGSLTLAFERTYGRSLTELEDDWRQSVSEDSAQG